jgi:hypothetical protein
VDMRVSGKGGEGICDRVVMIVPELGNDCLLKHGRIHTPKNGSSYAIKTIDKQGQPSAHLINWARLQ